MRVTGGVLKGHKLLAPDGAKTRPTAAKVREALFDIIGTGVEDACFLDICSGTGAMGIEALSRGAVRAVFVERSSRALAALRRNLDALCLGNRSRILPVSALRAVTLLGASAERFSLAYMDPPYAAQDRSAILCSLGEARIWIPGALLAVEHSIKDAPAAPDGFFILKTYRYGDTGLSLFQENSFPNKPEEQP